MSQRSSKKRKVTQARAMPIETIITRYKSAQQKRQTVQRQQQQQEQITTKSTKGNTKKQKTKDLIKPITIKPAIKIINELIVPRSIRKVPEVEENKEYYPEKLKRKLTNKKVVLGPKYSYKFVGDLHTYNKRKINIPRKEINYSAKKKRVSTSSMKSDFESSVSEPELSVIDMTKIEDSDSLDEEDLLEILTCPSPVWWEGPPSGYDEDSISTKALKIIGSNELNKIEDLNKNDLEQNSIYNPVREKRNENGILLNINIQNGDKNFIKRRSTLETLLTNIKTKKENKETGARKIDTSLNNNLMSMKNSSESLDEDQTLDESYDEIMNLENIVIPIENDTKDISSNKSETSLKSKITSSTDKLPIADQVNKDDEETSKDVKIGKGKSETDIVTTKLLSIKGLTIKKCDIKKIINKNNKIVTPQKLEQMKNNDKTELLSLIGLTIKQYDKKINCNEKNTGIHKKSKEIKKNKKNITIINDAIKLNNDVHVNNETKSKKVDTKELVTVYKILTEQGDDKTRTNSEKKIEFNDKFNNQMNSYYKYCKNITKNKKELKNTKANQTNESTCELCNPKNKSKVIPETETIKYCFQCSSINDTDICTYCITQANIVCTCRPSVYKCDKCSYTCGSSNNLADHIVKCVQ